MDLQRKRLEYSRDLINESGGSYFATIVPTSRRSRDKVSSDVY